MPYVKKERMETGMNYNEFKEALKREIEKRLEGKAAVSFRTISKMNQVEKESIQIESGR